MSLIYYVNGHMDILQNADCITMFQSQLAQVFNLNAFIIHRLKSLHKNRYGKVSQIFILFLPQNVCNIFSSIC